MPAPPSPPSSPDPPLPQAATPGAAGGQAPPPGQRPRKTWLSLAPWFQQNTFAPQWLPARLRHPLIGYVVAILIELAAASPALLLLHRFPASAFLGMLTLVGVVVIALTWGVGPSLLAAFVGTFLFYYVALLPQFSWTLVDPIGSLGSICPVPDKIYNKIREPRTQKGTGQDGRQTQTVFRRVQGESRVGKYAA